jgi:myo-inositol 2-dehydrogenase/D-chiro-inositol 1-dehydrogenase
LRRRHLGRNHGTAGIAGLARRGLTLTGDHPWRFEGEPNNNFLTEHEELFAGIRRGEPINNGEYMAKSTLMAILGRMATYTGQKVTWDQALHSQENLAPDRYAWDATPPVSEVARPGFTKLV